MIFPRAKKRLEVNTKPYDKLSAPTLSYISLAWTMLHQFGSKATMTMKKSWSAFSWLVIDIDIAKNQCARCTTKSAIWCRSFDSVMLVSVHTFHMPLLIRSAWWKISASDYIHTLIWWEGQIYNAPNHFAQCVSSFPFWLLYFLCFAVSRLIQQTPTRMCRQNSGE